MKSPGVRLLRSQELVVDDRPWEIAFDNVKVPVENRIGEEGDGFRHAQHWLNVGRIRHGARGIGVIERCLELGASYAKQRVTFGKPLAERQAVQWMLTDSFMEMHQLRLMVYDAAWKYDQGATSATRPTWPRFSATASPSRPPTAAWKSTAAWGLRPICRSKNSGATSAA